MFKMEGYYQQMVELQEKLRKSEEERYKLEEKFNEMMRFTRDVEQERLRSLRHKYNKFIEADRRRQERNTEIFRALERIETRAASLTSKTERYRHLRKQYAIYLKTKQNETQEQKITLEKNIAYNPNCRKTLFPENIEESYDSKVAKSKINMLEQYIRENNDTEKFLNNLATKITDKTTSKTNYDNFLDKVIRNSTFNERIVQEPLLNTPRFAYDATNMPHESLLEKGLQRFPNYQFDQRRNVQKDEPIYQDRYFCSNDVLNNEKYRENLMKPVVNVEISKDEVDGLSNRFSNQRVTDNNETNDEYPKEDIEIIDKMFDDQLQNHSEVQPKVLSQVEDSQDFSKDVNPLDIVEKRETLEQKEVIVTDDKDEEDKGTDQIESVEQVQEEIKNDVKSETEVEKIVVPQQLTEELKNSAVNEGKISSENLPTDDIKNIEARHQNVVPPSIEESDKLSQRQQINTEKIEEKQFGETVPKEYQSFKVLPEQTNVEEHNLYQSEEMGQYYQENLPQNEQYYEQTNKQYEGNEQINQQIYEDDGQLLEQKVPLEQDVEQTQQNYPQTYEQTEEYNQYTEEVQEKYDQNYQDQQNVEYAEDNQNYVTNPAVQDDQFIPEGQTEQYEQPYSEEMPQNYEYTEPENVYQQPIQQYDENTPNYQEQPQNQQYIQEEPYQGENYPPDQQYVQESENYPEETQEQQFLPEQQYQEGYDQQYPVDEQVNNDPNQQNYDPNQENYTYQQPDPNQQPYDESYQYEQGYTQENVEPVQYQTEEYQQNVDPNQQYEYPDQQYQENIPYDENYQQNYEQTPEMYPDVSVAQDGKSTDNMVLKEEVTTGNFEDSSISDNVGNIDGILGDIKDDVVPKLGQNLGKLLESDTESSIKQDTKVSNDSDFDFSQSK